MDVVTAVIAALQLVRVIRVSQRAIEVDDAIERPAGPDGIVHCGADRLAFGRQGGRRKRRAIDPHSALVRLGNKPLVAAQQRVGRDRRVGIVAIEAGVPDLWWKYVGLKGKVVGIDRFGLSGPGNKIMETLGITAKAVVDAAKSLI